MREALVAASVVVSGALLVDALSPEGSRLRRLAVAAALGPFIGFGAAALMGFYLLSLGLELELALPACWLGAVAATFARRRRWRREGVRSPTRRSARGRLPLAALLLAPAIVAITGLAIQMARQRPAGEWDAVAMWSSRARLLARTEATAPEAIRRLERGQPAYPLYLPMANAAQMAFVGQVSVRTPFSTGLATFLGLLATFACFAPGGTRWPATAALATTPAVAFWGLSQGADAVLASGVLLAILGSSGLLARESIPRVSPVVTGLALGLLPFVKDEGWLYAGVGAALVCWQARPGGPPREREAGEARAMLFAALPGWLAAVGFKLFWVGAERSTDFASRLRLDGWSDIEAWRSVAGGYLTHFLDQDPSRWSWAWPALAILLALGFAAQARPRGSTAAALWLVLGVVFCWALFFPVSPFGAQTHVRQALERLLLQAFPLLAILALWRLEPARDSVGGSDRDRGREAARP